MNKYTYALKLVNSYWMRMCIIGLTATVGAYSSQVNAYVTGVNQGSYMNLASNEFIYNPQTLTWKAINANGKVVRTGRGSGGQSYCPDIKRSCRTPSGTYHIMSKGGYGCKSSRYPKGRGGAPMPYCMYFNKNYAIHGSNDVPSRNASHGCIRVHTNDARWLSHNFMKIGTKVVVKPY